MLIKQAGHGSFHKGKFRISSTPIMTALFRVCVGSLWVFSHFWGGGGGLIDSGSLPPSPPPQLASRKCLRKLQKKNALLDN